MANDREIGPHELLLLGTQGDHVHVINVGGISHRECARCKRQVPVGDLREHFHQPGTRKTPYYHCVQEAVCYAHAMPKLTNPVFQGLVQRVIRQSPRDAMPWLAVDIAKEISDYEMVMEHCQKVYTELSFDQISKITTHPEHVIAANEQHWNDLCQESEQEARELCHDALADALEELREVPFTSLTPGLVEQIMRYFEAEVIDRTGRNPDPDAGKESTSD